MKYWIVLLWIPIGRIYIVGYQLYKAGVTWKELFTKKIYRIMLIESGIFGVFTPILNWMVRRNVPDHLIDLQGPEEVADKKIGLNLL